MRTDCLSVSPSIGLTTIFKEAVTAKDLTAADDVLGPIITDIKNVLSDAVFEVNTLALQPAEVILASADGTTQVIASELAQAASDLLHVSIHGL